MQAVYQSFFKVGLAAAFVTASVSASAALSLPITLNTSKLEANAKFNLSEDASLGLQVAAITISPSGTATSLSATSYNLPITSLTVDLFSFKPVKGSSAGASLDISGATFGGSLKLSNFTLDFKNNLVLADVTTPTGVTKQVGVYSFVVTKELTLTKNFTLDESVGNLTLTPFAVTTFQQALNLPGFIADLLKTLPFGTIDASVGLSKRKVPLAK